MRAIDATQGHPASISRSRMGASAARHPTELELQSLVEKMIDEAVTNGDLITLKRIATLQEAGLSVKTDGVGIAFADDARLFDAARWFVRQFKDLIYSGLLVANCLNYPPRSLVESSCQRAVDRLALPIKLSVRQKNKTVDMAMAEVTLVLELKGACMPVVAVRFKRHLCALARRRYTGSARANWGEATKVRQYLADVIAAVEFNQRLNPIGVDLESEMLPCTQGTQPEIVTPIMTGGSSTELLATLTKPRAQQIEPASMPITEGAHPSTQPTGTGEAASAMTPFAQPGGSQPLIDGQLSSDLIHALSRRVELVRRRTGTLSTPINAALHREVCRALADAIKEGDPLDVAALAMVLYDGGLSVRLDHLVRTPFDGALEVVGGTHGNAARQPIPVQEGAADPMASSSQEKKVGTGKTDIKPAAQGYYDKELLTTDELSQRIKYDSRTIRDRLKDTVFIKDVHYVQPFGRKTLYIWGPVARRLGLHDLLSRPDEGTA